MQATIVIVCCSLVLGLIGTHVQFVRDLRRALSSAVSVAPTAKVVSRLGVLFDNPHRSDAPLAVVAHGWCLYDPKFYSLLVALLHERGYKVAFLSYQRNYLPFGIVARFVRQLRTLLDEFGSPEVIVGHSGGAATAIAATLALPANERPGQLLLLTPGDGGDAEGRSVIPLLRLHWARPPEGLPGHTPTEVRVVTASDDAVVGSVVAKRIIEHLKRWPEHFLSSHTEIVPKSGTRLGHLFPMAGAQIADAPAILRHMLGDAAEIPPAAACDALEKCLDLIKPSRSTLATERFPS